MRGRQPRQSRLQPGSSLPRKKFLSGESSFRPVESGFAEVRAANIERSKRTSQRANAFLDRYQKATNALIERLREAPTSESVRFFRYAKSASERCINMFHLDAGKKREALKLAGLLSEVATAELYLDWTGHETRPYLMGNSAKALLDAYIYAERISLEVAEANKSHGITDVRKRISALEARKLNPSLAVDLANEEHMTSGVHMVLRARLQKLLGWRDYKTWETAQTNYWLAAMQAIEGKPFIVPAGTIDSQKFVFSGFKRRSGA